MTAFDLGECTDEDISLLAKHNQDYPPMKALLARLEAAEAYGNAMAALFRDPVKIQLLWDDWQKKAGK